MQVSDGYSPGSQIVFIPDKFNALLNGNPRKFTMKQDLLQPQKHQHSPNVHLLHVSSIIQEELSLIPTTSQITTYTEKKSLNNSANNTCQILDPRLHPKMSAISEIKERGKIELQCINKERQIEDCLANKGGSCTIMLTLTN